MRVNITSKSTDLLITISHLKVGGYFNLSIMLPDTKNIQFKNNNDLDSVLYILKMLNEYKFISLLSVELIKKIRDNFRENNQDAREFNYEID